MPSILLSLAWSLFASYERHQHAMTVVMQRADKLAGRLASIRHGLPEGSPQGLDALWAALAEGRALSLTNNGDSGKPGLAWQYGLGVASRVSDMAARAYASLLDRLLMPVLGRRVEVALGRAMIAGDRTRGYDALRVYLMLTDAKHFRGKPRGLPL